MACPAFYGISGHVTELQAIDEGAVPASAPVTSRFFVLPIAARWWVSTDNTFWQPGGTFIKDNAHHRDDRSSGPSIGSSGHQACHV